MQAHWGHMRKCTVEKSQTNATNVTLHLLGQTIWGDIWKHTVAKNQINEFQQPCVHRLRRHYCRLGLFFEIMQIYIWEFNLVLILKYKNLFMWKYENTIFNLLEFLCLLLALSSTASLGPHGANMISSTTLIYMSDKYKYTFKSTSRNLISSTALIYVCHLPKRPILEFWKGVWFLWSTIKTIKHFWLKITRFGVNWLEFLSWSKSET